MAYSEVVFRNTNDFNLKGDVSTYSDNSAMFFSHAVTGLNPILSTAFYALQSNDYFYFAFDCEDDFVVANMTAYNAKLYDEDVCEIFIAASGNIGKYIELEVSPNGVLFCGLIHNNLIKSRKLKLLKRAIATCLATKTDKGYLVEIKIEKKVIADKLNCRNGAKLVGNAYRIDRPQKGGWQLSALNPTCKEAFHVPEKFIPFA